MASVQQVFCLQPLLESIIQQIWRDMYVKLHSDPFEEPSEAHMIDYPSQTASRALCATSRQIRDAIQQMICFVRRHRTNSDLHPLVSVELGPGGVQACLSSYYTFQMKTTELTVAVQMMRLIQLAVHNGLKPKSSDLPPGATPLLWSLTEDASRESGRDDEEEGREIRLDWQLSAPNFECVGLRFPRANPNPHP